MLHTKDDQKKEVEERMKRAYSKLSITTTVIYGFFLFISIWLFAFRIPLGPLGSLPLSILPISGALAFTLASLRVVGPDKLATLLFFGDPAKEVGSGLSFVPFGISDLQIDTKNFIQLVFGTPTEGKNGQLSDIKDVTGSDLYEVREPLRITAHGPRGAYYGEKPDVTDDETWEKQKKEWQKIDDSDALGQKITIDPLLIARFRITHHPTFISNIGSVRKVNRQIIDTSETALQAFIGRRTIAHTQRSMDQVNDHLTERIEWLVGEPDAVAPTGSRSTATKGWWGIDVESVQLKSFGLPERVNKAIADAVQEVSKKEGAFQKAEASKRTKIREGEGAAKAQELLLFAQAKGYAKIAKSLETEEGKLAAQLEAMQKALSTGDNKLFLAGGQFSDILESLAGVLPKKIV